MNIAPAVIISLLSVAVNGIASTMAVLGGDTLLLGVSVLEAAASAYFIFFAMGLLTTGTMWDKIHTRWYKKILYVFTFPLFMLTWVPVSIAALLQDVTWQPITHTRKGNLHTIKEKK